MSTKPRLIVFISGSGTNLQALIDAIADGSLIAEITLVISNRKAVYGLVRAAQHGIPTAYHPYKPYREAGKSRDEYEADLAAQIASLQPDLLVLAGWMHVFGANFLHQFANRVINLHPALPGQFPGTHAIERAYEAYQRGDIGYSGCMVHLAVPEIDAGPVIVQTEVPLYPQDTLQDFADRMHDAEHRIIVEATRHALARTV